MKCSEVSRQNEGNESSKKKKLQIESRISVPEWEKHEFPVVFLPYFYRLMVPLERK